MKEILRIIRDGGLLTKGEIANKLEIRESTLDDILSLLSSKGYLKTVDSTEEAVRGCVGCPMSKECIQKTFARSVYVIADRGRDLLERS